MAEYTFRLAKEADRAAIVAFMRTFWDSRHPIIELPDFFDYYYKKDDGTLRVALCEQNGALCALAGFVPASQKADADVWVSLWVANPAAKGSGLELMAALPRLTGCRTLACNNIRPSTRPFYTFLGYTTGRINHYYRLADKDTYTVARVAEKRILPAQGDAVFTRLYTEAELENSGFVPPADANPYKDFWYIRRRYYAFPRQSYLVYAAALPADAAPTALFCLRAMPVLGTVVLRLVDYIGPLDFLPQCGSALQHLLNEYSAEYLDCYCAGVSPATMEAAGFAERHAADAAIIPNYLAPPLFENTDYYYFTNRPEHFTLWKADGDQDRPNIALD